MNSKLYAKLPTEQINSSTRHIDRVSIQQALNLINRQDQTVPLKVRAQISSMTKAVQLMVSALKHGGRIFFMGAGTSGRLGVLEAAECPPTFNTAPSRLQAFMAGGRSSVFRSKEGAEDRGAEAKQIVLKKLKPSDVLIGIAASGVTPFVQQGLLIARRRKIKTVLVTCFPKVKKNLADVVIAINTGPEAIAGSTRLKAATATKMVLNSLTVVSMVQLGKVFGNLMVDLQPRSNKLRARATRLISSIGGVSEKKAAALLKISDGKTKTAILMAKKNINRKEAERRLKISAGRLFQAFNLS